MLVLKCYSSELHVEEAYRERGTSCTRLRLALVGGNLDFQVSPNDNGISPLKITYGWLAVQGRESLAREKDRP